MKKQDVLEFVSRLPDEIDAEQLMHEIYLRAKLDRAEAAVAQGEVVPHEEVVERSRVLVMGVIHASRDFPSAWQDR